MQLVPPATAVQAGSLGPFGAVTPEIGSHPGWPLILYFHHVRDDIEHYTVLRRDDFEFVLGLLSRWFVPMDPRHLADLPGDRPDEPTCLLTFDDGYGDVWDHAVPVMEEQGWRAVIFVSTGQVGTTGEHPVRGVLGHMTWRQLRELDTRGYVVASHGHTHRDMSCLSPEEVCAEITTAQACLTSELGPGSSGVLAYPYGNQPACTDALAGILPPLCFSSVKASAAPWTDCPRLVRRTFVPAGARRQWPAVVEGWRRQWESASLP